MRKGPDDMSDSSGTEKPEGAGSDGTIPASEDGLALGVGDAPSNFNPEEDPESAVDAEKDGITDDEAGLTNDAE